MQSQVETRKKTGFLKKMTGSTAVMILLVLIVLGVVIQVCTGSFFTRYNTITNIRTISFTAIVAIGQTLVLLTGGIDLSVAGIAGLSNIISAWLMVNTGLHPYICVVLTVLGGFLCGCINGVLVTKVRINPFITTLATGEIFTGFIYVLTQGWPIQNIPEAATFLGQGMIMNTIPMPVVFMVISALIFIYVLRYTAFGRHVYAIGGNENASRIVGINVFRTKMLVYAFSSMMGSLAGVLIMCRLGAAQPSTASNWVMPSVTAAIIGGTSLNGGVGGIPGTIVGAALTTVISNAIVLLSISTYWEKVITGLVVLVAVTIDILKKRVDKN